MYPNKKAILTAPGPPIKQEKIILKKWKEIHYKGWSILPEKKKIKAIKILLLTINKIKKGSRLKIKFDKKLANCYTSDNNTIILNKASIITSLHELSHHLFGESEEKACKYSIWIFKEAFPRSFKKLIFKNHLLTK